MIDFILPGIGYANNLFRVNILLIRMKKEMPEYFISDRNIIGIHGNFTALKWSKTNSLYNNGLRRPTFDDMVAVKKELEELGVSAFLDVANPFVTEKNIFDYHDNMCLEALNSDMNYISVSSNILKDYITNTYKYYKVIADEILTCTCEKLNMDGVVYDTTYSGDMDAVKDSGKKHIIIPDSICYSCGKRNYHIRDDCNANLRFFSHEEVRIEYKDDHFPIQSCPNFDKSIIYNRKKLCDFITEDKLNEYANNGFTIFKLDKYPFYTLSDYIDILTYYLVRNGFREMIKTSLLHVIEKEKQNEFKR